MPTTPVAYAYVSGDSSDVVEKFGSPYYDALQASGWAVVAAEIQAACIARGFDRVHFHNPAGRGGDTDGISMVLDAFIKRRSDAPFMVNGFRKAWSTFARQYPTRCYFGSQWTNSRVNRHLGVDRGFWVTATSYVRFDRVKYLGDTYQARTDHTSSGGNTPPNGTYWDVVATTARNLGPSRIDRYFRRLWDSVEIPLGAGMELAFDFSGETPADDPSVPWLNSMFDNGVKIATEASPLLGYTHLFDFDTIITNEFLPQVETGGFAEPLANLPGSISILLNLAPGYNRTHTAWASGVAYTGDAVLKNPGSAVSFGGSSYFCLISHTSSGSNQPGTGGGASFWRLIVPTDYFIPNATFSNESSWYKTYVTTMFANNYGVMLPYYSDAFTGGNTLADYLPDGYIAP